MSRSRRVTRTRTPGWLLVAGLFLAGCTSPPDGAGSGNADGRADASATAAGPASSLPTLETTGPRLPIADLKPSAEITTDADGQVIEGLDVRTRVKIVHDDVRVQDVRVTFDVTQPGAYAIHVTHKADGTCPTGVVIDHVEVVGDTEVLADNAKAVYGECPFTLSNSSVHEVGSAVRITSGATLLDNYIHANHSVAGSDAHRSGVGLNGGSGNVIAGNSIDCEGSGCSGALVMYGSLAQVRDILIEGNLFNTSGSYCTYAGSVDSKDFPQSRDVRYIGNLFGRKYHEQCGRYGPVSGSDASAPGFVWRDNVWADTGAEVR